ncbi:MAG: hypothetical protein AAF721_32245, partial [Myxococcota bacterium]
MTRLLLKDALRRYGVGLSMVVLTGGYLWRSLPPWVVRRWLWSAPWPEAAAVVGVAGVGYALATHAVARQLVSSQRLTYWRQFAIPPRAWQHMHGSHLATMHLPAGVLLVYMLQPGGAPAAVGVGLVAYVGGLTLQLRRLTGEPSPWPTLRVPFVALPSATLLRLSVLAILRRRPSAAVVAVGWQIGLVGLGVLGSVHVAHVEPDAAWPLLRTLVVVGGLAAGSLIPVATRLLDRDR